MLRAFMIYLGVAMFLLFVTVQLAHLYMSPLEGLGTTFFIAVEQREYDTAYRMFTRSFRENYTKQEVLAFLKQNDLHQIKKTEWHTERQEGSRGLIMGNVYLVSGRSVPIEIYALQETETKYPHFGDISKIPFVNKFKIWKISHINVPGQKLKSSDN